MKLKNDSCKNIANVLFHRLRHDLQLVMLRYQLLRQAEMNEQKINEFTPENFIIHVRKHIHVEHRAKNPKNEWKGRSGDENYC